MGRPIGKRRPRLRQRLDKPRGHRAVGADLQYAQRAVGRPRRADLGEGFADVLERGNTNRRGLHEVLGHRQRGRLESAQPVPQQSRQFFGRHGDKRQLGNQLGGFR